MKIFARIFLSFWLATVLAISVSLALVTFHVPGIASDLSRSIPAASLERCALEGSRYYYSPNEPLKSLQIPNCKVAFIIDAADRDILSRTMPSNILYLVKRARTTGDMQVAPLPGNTVIAIPELQDQRGPIVVVFFMPNNNRDAARAFLWQAIPFSGAAALICYLLTGYILAPLKRLGMVADGIGAGNLANRVVGKLDTRRDEFGNLARTFNRMADRIQSLVTSQRMFLAHVSHELGSPLTRLNMTLVLTRRKAPLELSPELDRIERETKELNLLVQELLLLARLESGNELSCETIVFPISQVIGEVANNAAFEANQVDRFIRITSQEDFHVAGNPQLLKRAFDNVVRNAIRFTSDGSAVEVAVLRRNGIGEITIRDSGPGVDSSALSSIFEPFSRTDASGGHSGVGLGLAIARHAVLAHRGMIVARNRSEGGLIVTIELPIAQE